ncbi:hypothetical protein AX15_004084 [Amanita polypyramis BW_CC]|nr:hypothetical protein AX15_004084 [Amanita polypyramis BW_CC]
MFKALYNKSFNQCAINHDEAEEHEIYKIDLLKAMFMAQKAWSQVLKEMIQHCWGHALIQPYVSLTHHPCTHVKVTMTVRPLLKKDSCSPQFEWHEEEDSDKALKTIDELEEATKCCSGLKMCITAHPPQLIKAEAGMMDTVMDLKLCNCIFGDLPTIDDILDPPEE